MFLANKLNKGGGSPTPVDAQFNYVTMLLHGDGTNGAQNNTFLDSSTNNFTITRNGNTTQGSFSPYGSNWSNYFDGSSSFLNWTGANCNGGTWTLEAWVFPTSNGGGAYGGRGIISCGDVFLNMGFDSANKITLRWYTGSSGFSISSTTVLALNTWYHVAVTWQASTSAKVFINGVLENSTTSNLSIASSTSWQIGREGAQASYFTGYISNARVSSAILYSSTFTPATTPLTVGANTNTLTCQSNRFVDNSTNNYSITVNGTPSVQRFNPFGASTAYSTSVIGGSGYFDGSGDYLSTTVTAKSAGTASFTYELWFYEQATDGLDRHLFTTRTSDANTGFDCRVNASGVINLQRGGSTDFFTSTAIANVACWNHLAIVRNGASSLTIYLNGVSIGTASLNYNFTVTDYKIGVNYATDDAWKGYITDFRYTKAAVYTANFTPNTAPLAAITDTALLLNFTNAAIFDNAMMNDLETVGNAQISTSVKKYGTGSLAFDGSGDYLASPPTPNLTYGTGNFTIEAWVYLTTTGTIRPIVECRSGGGSTAGYAFLVDENNYLNVFSNGFKGTSSSTITGSSWTHVALVRAGTGTNQTTYYINGTASGTITLSGNLTDANTNQTIVGNSLSSGGQFNGYIDDLRITKGYARYTANFTAPTSALSDTGPY